MKEQNENTPTETMPTETEMNEMYQNSWLDFHADAQEAQQTLNRRYAKMVNAFGSYKKMPDEVKEIVKQDYAAHKAKWSENGEEMQKRFGVKEAEPKPILNQEQVEKREQFLKNLQDQRKTEQSHSFSHEP